MVRSIGLEPTTPTMSRWCSNQLSYERIEIPRCLSDSGTNSSEQGEIWQEEKCNFVRLPVRLLSLYPSRRFFRRYPSFFKRLVRWLPLNTCPVVGLALKGQRLGVVQNASVLSRNSNYLG